VHKTAVCTHINGDMQENANQQQEKYYETTIRRQHFAHVNVLLAWCHGSWIFVFDLPLSAYRCVIIRPVVESEKKYQNVTFYPFIYKSPVDEFSPNLCECRLADKINSTKFLAMHSMVLICRFLLDLSCRR